MNNYSEIAGRPGHRCGQCRYYKHAEVTLDSRCCLVPPKPNQSHGSTKSDLFCPSWEPTHPVKKGCKLDTDAMQRELNFVGETKPEDFSIVSEVSSQTRKASIGPERNAVPRFNITLNACAAHRFHADDCPCRSE